MKNKITLMDLTRHESGVILFQESALAICCNWSSFDGIPNFLGGFLIDWNPLEIAEPAIGQSIDNVEGILEGYKFIYDISNGSVLNEKIGTKYELPDSISVIVFEDWH